MVKCVFFLIGAATTNIYTLALHTALPLYEWRCPSLRGIPKPAESARVAARGWAGAVRLVASGAVGRAGAGQLWRPEEHTCELQ